MIEIDYQKCTLQELIDVERNIDKVAHPDRHAEVVKLIAIRQSELTQPEPAPSGWDKYHTFWNRFWAAVIDSIVLMPLTWFNAWMDMSGVQGLPLFIWSLTMPSAYIVYTVLMHAAYGQTLGKMATKVIVLDKSEKKLSYKQAVLRDIVPILVWPLNIYFGYLFAFTNITDEELVNSPFYIVVLSAGLGWFLLEIATMLFNEKRRAVHDFIAGSVVIKTHYLKR